MAITPNIWFNGNAAEAVRFYTDLFPDSHLIRTVHYPEEAVGFPEGVGGRELTIDFSLGGQRLVAINAGPEFRPTPALSFTVSVGADDPAVAREQIDTIWAGLSDGGTVFMPLGSTRSPRATAGSRTPRRLVAVDPGRPGPKPALHRALVPVRRGPDHRAEEAIEYYTGCSPTPPSARWPDTKSRPDRPRRVRSCTPTSSLTGQLFVAMDSGVPMDAAFSEGVSPSVACRSGGARLSGTSCPRPARSSNSAAGARTTWGLVADRSR